MFVFRKVYAEEMKRIRLGKTARLRGGNGEQADATQGQEKKKERQAPASAFLKLTTQAVAAKTWVCCGNCY